MKPFYLLPNNVVSSIRSHIFELIESGNYSETHLDGSETRIYGFHKISKPAEDLWHEIEPELKKKFPNLALDDCLAIVNKRVKNQPDLMLGRWHKDSLRKQIKIFVYLTSVGKTDGATQVIKGSNSYFANFKLLIRNSLIKITDLFSKKRAYQSIPDDVIDACFKESDIYTVTAAPGECFIIDTSNVHRASPNLGDTRIALTYYLLNR